MRVSGAILAVVLGASSALAQGDVRGDYGPIKEAPAAETKPEPPAATPPATAAKKPARKKKEAAKPAATAPAAQANDTAAPKAQPKPPRAKTAKKPEPAPDKTATSGSANPGAPSAKPSGLADTYAAIPRAERMAIEDDLTWSGDYSGPIDGQSSERLVDAVKSYQKRHKAPATGLLSAEERAALAAGTAPRKDAAGWRLTGDPVTGARLGVPGKFATRTKAGPNGTTWSSEQGQLQIETFRIDTGATLEAVFDQQKRLPRRRVSSSSLQADSFVITGMQGLKKMVVRAAARDGQVRGLTILYDQAMEGSIDPLIGPMASAFVPFAGVTLAGAADTPRRKVEYGTGIVVSAAGYVVTARALLEGCNVVALPGLGNAEQVATDAAGEVALLRVYGARGLTPIALIGASSGDSVTLVGIADPQAQGGGDAVSTVNAALGAAAATGARTLATAPALGFAGAAAIDAQGRVAGLVVLNAPVIAGPAAAGAPRAAVVPAERIRNFLEAHYIPPASGTHSVDAAKASLVRVICVRK